MGMRLATALCVTLLAAMLATAPGTWAQEQEPAPAAEAPVALPAEALASAAELEGHAQPKLLEWVRRHARTLLRDEFTPEALSAESIARLFPREAPAAQEAIRFLVGYEIYRRASDRQRSRASVLRDLEREIRDLEHRMRILEETGAPIGSVAARNREARLADTQAQLEQLQLQRRLAANSEEAERKRVDVCLRWLAEAHARVKHAPAEILRAVPAPRT